MSLSAQKQLFCILQYSKNATCQDSVFAFYERSKDIIKFVFAIETQSQHLWTDITERVFTLLAIP